MSVRNLGSHTSSPQSWASISMTTNPPSSVSASNGFLSGFTVTKPVLLSMLIPPPKSFVSEKRMLAVPRLSDLSPSVAETVTSLYPSSLMSERSSLIVLSGQKREKHTKCSVVKLQKHRANSTFNAQTHESEDPRATSVPCLFNKKKKRSPHCAAPLPPHSSFFLV